MRFYGQDENKIELKLPGKLQVHGNIMIKFKYHATLMTQDLFRITFNTAFIGTSNMVKLSRWEISPESCQKDYEKFSKDFSVSLYFENYCRNGCRSHITSLSNLCINCCSIMSTEIENWSEAFKVIDARPKYESIEQAREFLNADPETVEAA